MKNPSISFALLAVACSAAHAFTNTKTVSDVRNGDYWFYIIPDVTSQQYIQPGTYNQFKTYNPHGVLKLNLEVCNASTESLVCAILLKDDNGVLTEPEVPAFTTVFSGIAFRDE